MAATRKKTASSLKRAQRPAPRAPGAWTLTLAPEALPSFVLCLGLGTLHAIRRGVLPPQDGIWTLGVWKLQKVLRKHRVLPPDVLAVFAQGDELSALSQLVPESLGPTLDGFIETLDRALAAQKETGWGMLSQWEAPTRDVRPAAKPQPTRRQPRASTAPRGSGRPPARGGARRPRGRAGRS